ncbi:MAG: amino acid adenylation domain-containing protein [Bacteroidia bacterium]|nr:amino acid adenylation domain-containing protein [Bacteroidia bacterium]
MSSLPPGIHFEAIDFDPFAPLTVSVASTEPQREIFTSVLLGGDAANCAYNESVTLHLEGPLNAKFLKAAFEKIMARHDALRSTFSEDGMLLHIAAGIPLPWHETQAADPSEKQFLLDKFTKEETLLPFDLRNGPLIRVHLIRFSESDHALLVTGHHIICDGWSLSLILRDLGEAYSAMVLNTEAHAEPAVSFAEFAKAREKYQGSTLQQETESYWVQQFREEVPVLEFPTDHARPALRSFHAKRLDVQVPEELVKNLRLLSRKTNSSFVTTMLSAFEVFLYRITGQENLVVGLPAAGQNVEGLYHLVGHCVNLLPLRSSIRPAMKFTEYLQERRAYLFDAYDHQQFTFGSLIQKLNIQRDPSRIPLVPVVFNVDIGFTEGFHFEGCRFSVRTNPRYFENFEIFLNASGQGDRLTLECTFNNDLFSEEMMDLRMKEFIRVMESIVQNPDEALSRMEVVTDEEKKLLEAINRTGFQHEKAAGIHECIEETAKNLKKNHVAIVCGDRHITYEELLYLSGHWAARLQARGLKQGDLVGICLPRLAELPVVLLSVMTAGGAYVPLDPGFPAERLHFMVEDSAAKFVIISRELQARFNFPEERIIYFEDLQQETNGVEPVRYPVDEHTLAYVLYTSGSTGKPKGVAVRHASVTNLLNDLSRKMGLDREERLLAVTTISFDISVLELFMPLMNGAGLHIAGKEQAMDPAWMSSYIDKKSIRFLQATPATFELLFAGGWKGKRDLAILCGGEALRKELAVKLLSCNREVWNLYGPTETTIWSTAGLITDEASLHSRNGILTIGKPVANTSVFIMDQNGQPCPIGVAGELWIGGAGVSAGYLNRPELNAEKFIPSPDGNGLVYRTGDRVLLDLNGYLYFLNRFDHQVKVRGYRIELGEIESALNRCSAIRQAVVMAIPDRSGQNMLAVWYLAADAGKTSEEITASCKTMLAGQLPDYMIPSSWTAMEAFPLTPNGKVNRNELPLPGVTASLSDKKPEEKMSGLQQQIRELWQEVLQIPDIRLEDNFFELGGHSILAVKIIVELERMTGKKMPLAVLFSSPTIAELSRLYENQEEEELWSPIVPLREGGINKPFFFAHGISGNVFKYHALAQRLHGSQPSYGLQAYGLNGKDTPFHDLKEMAAYHVAAIRQFQPKGPYYLSGGSFGGYLAYEMAVQLRAIGEEVGFLCLFDIDAAKKKDFLPAGVKQLVDAQLLAGRFMKRAVELAKADKEERRNYFEARKKQQQRNNDIESWLEKHKVAEIIGSESAAYFKRIEEACHDALMSYKIPAYDGDILLVRARDSYYNNEYDKDLGWSHFTKGNVQVLTVPGDHNTIFWEPNVDVLAQNISELLEKSMR